LRSEGTTHGERSHHFHGTRHIKAIRPTYGIVPAEPQTVKTCIVAWTNEMLPQASCRRLLGSTPERLIKRLEHRSHGVPGCQHFRCGPTLSRTEWNHSHPHSWFRHHNCRCHATLGVPAAGTLLFVWVVGHPIRTMVAMQKTAVCWKWGGRRAYQQRGALLRLHKLMASTIGRPVKLFRWMPATRTDKHPH
jgi:hypothetical protein